MVDCKKLVNLGPPFRSDNIGAFSWAVTLFVLLLLPLAAEAAPQPTTTALAVAPNPATAGEVVTLTATVTSNGEPVAVGTLTFLSGKQVLATVQVVQASGAATLKTRFAPGMFGLNAQYNANNLFQASQSGPQQLTVTGTEPSLTTLTAQPDGNNFDFTATVFGFGFPVPTGQVMFNDLTGGYNIGTIMLAGPGMSSFQPQQTFLVGHEPLGVAVGDFNGDGFADLAVVNQPDNAISVLLGQGNGSFQQQEIIQVGAAPPFIAVADFNSDGVPDLAVTNVGDGTVSVLLGKGDGTFQPQQTFPVGIGPVGVAVGDFNGDGFADLAVANQPDNTISVLLGNGDGTFQPQQIFKVGQRPYGLAIGDFNKDGIADIVVANLGDGTVSVLLGKGDGTFQPQQTYDVGQNPYWVATGDLNQDGIPDLVVANGSDGTVSVLLGTGDGTFQPQQTYPVGATPTSVVIADFNGDGIPDLATANSGVNTVSVLLGSGKGAFQPQQTYVTGTSPYAVASADFNGDGVPDLAVPNAGDVTVSVLLGGAVTSAQLNNVPIIGSGIHNIQSNYAPDASSIYAASASNTVMLPAGGKATPSVTLTGSPSPQSPVNYGNNEYFTALVQSPGGGTPTGTVNFMEGSTVLGTANLVANASGQGSVANYTNNTLVIGTHEVTATYSGDSNFNSASSSPPVTVTVITPFMLIPQNGNSGTVSPGGQITFSVAVNAAWQDQPLIYAVMTCKSPAGTGITCSVACPPSPAKPPGLTNLCVLTQMTGTVATVTVDTSGAAHLVPPLHRDGERRVVAALMGLSGIGLVGLVLLPFRLRREAVGGVLFLVIVVLCFGTSCATSFAPGITSPPVNNTFYITVNAELREENPFASTGYNALGVQTFLYSLLIK
jgi:Big-like domain-containing protein/VCBS repeat protein/FG-GAP repeat protein